MKLGISIFVATILGYILLMLGPLFGGLLAFGVVAGCLFRGIYMLNEMNKKLKKIVPDTDKVSEAYEAYLKELETRNLKI